MASTSEIILSAEERNRQINLIVGNYSRVFLHSSDTDTRVEYIARTLSVLDIKPHIIAVAFQRLAMTQSEMPTLKEVIDVIRSVEKSAGIVGNDAPNPQNAWHEVIRHLSAIYPSEWSHPFIEQVVKKIGERYIIEHEWEARELFISEYESLCDDEMNKILLGML
jgi:hypothetical protein